MATYVLLRFQDETAVDAATTDEQSEQNRTFRTKYGHRLTAGEALATSASARAVRRYPVAAVTDGPFAVTTETLTGFWVLEADDLDDAIAVAEDVPAPHGGVEIRPVEVFS